MTALEKAGKFLGERVKLHADRELEKLFLDSCLFGTGQVYAEYSQIGNDIPPTGGVVKYTGCRHEFAAYQGFSECYEYCRKCDEKR